MNRNKELAKNTIIIALGKICTQFVTFLLLPVYTRFLTTDEYGTIDLVITCTNLISPILSLQLERSVFRFLVDTRHDEDLQKEIISTAFGAIIPSILLTLAILPIIGTIFNIQYWIYILFIIITSILANIALQIPRGLGKNIHFSIGSALVGISNALIGILSVTILGWGIRGVLFANIISHIIGIIYIFFSLSLAKKVKLSRRNKTTLKKLLRFSLPMIPSDICYWIINASDRLLIFLFLGNSMNGIYATATKFPALIITAYNVFNMSWMETVSAHAKDDDASEYLSKVFNEIVKLSGSLCLVANAIIAIVFNIIVGESFANSYQYIAILIFGSFFNIVVGALSALYFGYKKTTEIAKTNALAAILNILINFALIHVIGVWAAVISTVVAYIVVAVYRLINIQKAVTLRPKILDFFIISLAFIPNMLLYQNSNIWAKIANLAFSCIFALIYNRHFLISISAKTIKKLKKGTSE